MTANNSYLEVLTVVQSNLTTYSQFQNSFSVASNKFTFSSSSHQVNNFIQWVTSSTSSCGVAYWLMLQLEPIYGTSSIRIPYYVDVDIIEVKMNIVIVTKQFGAQLGTFYALYSQVGSFSYSTVRSYDEEFYYNFGLNTTRFGASTSG